MQKKQKDRLHIADDLNVRAISIFWRYEYDDVAPKVRTTA